MRTLITLLYDRRLGKSPLIKNGRRRTLLRDTVSKVLSLRKGPTGVRYTGTSVRGPDPLGS